MGGSAGGDASVPDAGGSAGSAGAGDAGGVGPPRDAGPWPDPTLCPSGGGSPLTGTWVGYVENHTFPSGSDAVRLTIRGASDGWFCGAIRFGADRPQPPPATNPDIGYPPELDPVYFVSMPFEGFAHTLINGSVSGKRVKFQARLNELWKGWCALQTPYQLNDSDIYMCLPGWAAMTGSTSPDGGDAAAGCVMIDPDKRQQVPVDCGKLDLCRNHVVCTCDATSCFATPDTERYDFDGQVEGGELKGTFLAGGAVLPGGSPTSRSSSFAMPELINVYFTKTD
jgi:hypothetical protein